MLVATRPPFEHRITAGVDQRVVASFMFVAPRLPVLGARSPAAERAYERFRSQRMSGTALQTAGLLLLTTAAYLALDSRDGPASAAVVLGVGGFTVGVIHMRRSEHSLARAIDLYNATLPPPPR